MTHDLAGRRTWIALGIIVAIALALRLGSVLSATRPNGFSGIDPDGYAQNALKLVPQEHEWRWNPQAVRFGRFTKAPLYPVLLSLFVLVSPASYPFSAAVGHAIAGVATVLFVFWLGRRLHGNRAGLVAAGLLAVYMPAVLSSWVFFQENFYLPLLTLALALLTRASVTNARPRAWAIAGAALGVAALTRSMPLYFVAPAAIVHVALAAERRAAARQALGFLLGFSLLVVPYSAYISATVGALVPIENMGTVRVRMVYPSDSPVPIHYAPAPGFVEAARAFVRGFTDQPVPFITAQIDRVKGLFQLRGGRYLQLRPGVATAGEARRLKAMTHLGYDVPFAIAALLTPLGWAFARARPAASLLVLWVLVNVGLTAAAGMSGARYRAPIEPPLFVLGAVLLAGGWRPLTRWSGAGALAGTLLMALAVGLSVPATARGRTDYGLHERSPGASWRAWGTGEAGFNVLTTSDGTLEFSVTPRAGESTAPIEVAVMVEGELVDSIDVAAGQTKVVRYRSRAVDLVYVELRATPAAVFDIAATGEAH